MRECEKTPNSVAGFLKKPAEFRRVFDSGQRVTNNYFALHFAAATTTAARVGFAVSKKVDQRAVVRNRIKRKARENFRAIRAQLPPADYVLVARHACAKLASGQFDAELDQLWRRSALKIGAADGKMPVAASASPDS